MKTDKKLKKVFQIEIVETLSNIVEVGAENEQEALLKARVGIAMRKLFYMLMILLTLNLIFLNTIKIT
ncbi:DpnD/PcfM family protein [Psychrobacter sp. AOP22-C1-22]|uniref:DpnD/PcfM family protein n=1 Tax=unclassified Psychrobacter TaxID=196806 RepID=UPI001CE43564|nr:DpnD/PcfM family protein [Psychrobacter sp. FME6]